MGVVDLQLLVCDPRLTHPFVLRAYAPPSFASSETEKSELALGRGSVVRPYDLCICWGLELVQTAGANDLLLADVRT